MSFKERMSKQNNSIKVLLRKLKRHDTIVVAIAVVIALALSGGLIYLTTPAVTASAKQEFEQTEKENNEKTIEKLDELSSYLDGLDKSLIESQKSISSFSELSSAEKDAAKEYSEKNTERITNTVTDKVTGLGHDLTTLHNTITNTQTNIEKLKETIEKESGEMTREQSESLSKINSDLDNIKSEYGKAQENTKSLIEELEKQIKSGDETLSKDMAGRYQELLDKLNGMNTQFEKDNTAAIDSFKSELGSLETKINGLFEKIDAQMSQSNENLSNKFDTSFTEVNTNIDNKFESMNGSVQGNFEELKNLINTQMQDVNDRFNQVFTSVGNGKKLLASALLTKNIIVGEDATFAEIAKAIEEVPVEIVLDNGDVAGEIEYDYHFHTDGQDNECDESLISEDRQGGCYTEAVYHEHTDACYKIRNKYNYWTYWGVEDLGYAYDGAPGVAFHKYHCPYCGHTTYATDPSHPESSYDPDYVAYRHGEIRSVVQEKELICGVEEGALEGFKTSCGLVHGQVVSARIVFADEYASYNTTQPNASSSDAGSEESGEESGEESSEEGTEELP
ncbi:MAG: apolipoprotein A1/A4/E family protein [Butyrivibrio sp.]|nr:apolipoprotein A1/A4/E family protein [Butyrivibrio sp.]MBO6197747.1 apolipoprotein A1/A4/E family protein [Butyrivibrio sp.]